MMYSAATVLLFVGLTYAAVPLYRAFCAATGFSGTPITDPERFAPSRLVPAVLDPSTQSPTKRIRVSFNADASDAIPWSFTPQQKEIYVLPGETALAFYTAKNKSDRDIIGIATYNVSPDKVSIESCVLASPDDHAKLNLLISAFGADRTVFC
jgi:cytochrome c oxidase assembly protein subunit 11